MQMRPEFQVDVPPGEIVASDMVEHREHEGSLGVVTADPGYGRSLTEAGWVRVVWGRGDVISGSYKMSDLNVVRPGGRRK
jgi:hypothetical protein